MRVVFEDYWQEVRAGMAQTGESLPPHDLELFLAEMNERGVDELRVCLRWLHLFNVEAAGGSLPAFEGFAHKPYVHFGTYLLITARTPDGIVFEYRQRLYPEDGDPGDCLQECQARLTDAGFRVRAGRWQS